MNNIFDNTHAFVNNFVRCDSKGNETSYWQQKFFDTDMRVEMEYKYEWSRHLIRKNLEQITKHMNDERKHLRFSFYSKSTVRKVFDISRTLRQPPEVGYLALDILDRFMIDHFFRVVQTMKEKGNWTDRIRKIVTNRMANQSYLRILSSVQLASKYYNNFRAVTTNELHDLLISSDVRYFPKCDFVKSEARIFQTLDCHIPTVTPLTYVEMFFEDLTNGEIIKNIDLTLSTFLNLCIDVLDVAMFYHKDIFQKFHVRITGKSFWISREQQFLQIEADYMYLAASVIHTAATLIDPTHIVPEELLKFFSYVTQYKSQEIKSLGNVILEYILSD